MTKRVRDDDDDENEAEDEEEVEEEEDEEAEEDDYDSEEVKSDEEEEEEEDDEPVSEPTAASDDLIVLGKNGCFVKMETRGGTYENVSPWRDCAITVLCIFKFRRGPWNNCLDHNVRKKIAQYVYGQAPMLANICYYSGEDFYPYIYETNRWDDNHEFILGCVDCRRPTQNNMSRQCWLHLGQPYAVCKPVQYANTKRREREAQDEYARMSSSSDSSVEEWVESSSE